MHLFSWVAAAGKRMAAGGGGAGRGNGPGLCQPSQAGGRARRRRVSLSAVTMAIIVLSSAAVSVAISSGVAAQDPGAEPYIERSVPFVGAEVPRLDGVDGRGILIAVIDTGVDYGHPDMLGWLGEGKVAGGQSMLWDGGAPLDTDGHGTQVAGVAVADGSLQGVAPKSRILAYKVSDDGNNVSSDLIARAIVKAADDGADVINVSMGVAGKNAVIENAINTVLDRGVLVVVAAGNAGPEPSTIGSPGRSGGSLTVGATYNNLTSSMVATLDVGESYSYTVIPMVGTGALAAPIEALLVPAGYAKESDFDDVDVRGAIVVAERGSDIEDELLYFSLKEKHAADAGAAALIVYNNEEGFFIGELIHEFIEPGYAPRIPVVSMEREEGLELLELMRNGTGAAGARLHLFHNPDFVAHFSSRGPVSPFYIKPDLVAPGAYINTTQVGSAYEIMSGTSYAAPHASGTAALLLQKNPGLDRHEIKSVIMTTADPVTDAYGTRLSVHEAGSGRLNVSKAYEAQVAILPPSFVATISDDRRAAEARLEVRPIAGGAGGAGAGLGSGDGARLDQDKVKVRFEGPDFVQFAHALDAADSSVLVRMTIANSTGDTYAANATGNASEGRDGEGDYARDPVAPYGEHEGRVTITYDGSEYTVPFVVHYTRGSVQAAVESMAGSAGPGADGSSSDGPAYRLSFDISHPDGWEFAKIDVIDSIYEESVTVTATPESLDAAYLDVRNDGVYWVDAKIRVQGESHTAYDFVHVGFEGSGMEGVAGSADGSSGSSAPPSSYPDDSGPEWVVAGGSDAQVRAPAFAPYESLPARQIAIVAVFAVSVGVVGVLFWLRGRARGSPATEMGATVQSE